MKRFTMKRIKRKFNRRKRTLLNFKEAFDYMNSGFPVKRKDWEGYWIIEDEAIVVHLKDGNNINLSKDESDSKITMSNVTKNDWEVANVVNCSRFMKDYMKRINGIEE